MLGEDGQQTRKACLVQRHAMLLTLGLVNTDLGAFTTLQFRGQNPPNEPLFQLTMANAKARTHSILLG